jgi:hypothetical protein
MKGRVNTYLAILVITAAGSWAAYMILNVAISNTLSARVNGSEANYSDLQQSILKK